MWSYNYTNKSNQDMWPLSYHIIIIIFLATDYDNDGATDDDNDGVTDYDNDGATDDDNDGASTPQVNSTSLKGNK